MKKIEKETDNLILRELLIIEEISVICMRLLELHIFFNEHLNAIFINVKLNLWSNNDKINMFNTFPTQVILETWSFDSHMQYITKNTRNYRYQLGYFS